MIWSGANNHPGEEINVLVRSAHLQNLINELVETTDSEISENHTVTARNETNTQDV